MKRTRSNLGISLPRRTRAEMIIRSLFIQATNNFERMLSLGFLFALWPVIKIKYPRAEDRREAAVRHLSFFNTQPYFANCILGVVAHAELRDAPGAAAEVDGIKSAMMGAFGALGDDLFWAGIMPAATLVALILSGAFPQGAFAAAIAALLIYNVFHFWARVRLFEIGFRLGRRVTSYLKLLRLPQFALAVKVAGAFLLGIFAVIVVWRAGLVGAWGIKGAVVTVGAVLGSFVFQLLGLRPGRCWYVTGAIVAAWGMLVL